MSQGSLSQIPRYEHDQSLLTRVSDRSRKKQKFAGFSESNCEQKESVLWEICGNFQDKFCLKMIGKKWLIS